MVEGRGGGLCGEATRQKLCFFFSFYHSAKTTTVFPRRVAVASPSREVLFPFSLSPECRSSSSSSYSALSSGKAAYRCEPPRAAETHRRRRWRRPMEPPPALMQMSRNPVAPGVTKKRVSARLVGSLFPFTCTRAHSPSPRSCTSWKRRDSSRRSKRYFTAQGPGLSWLPSGGGLPDRLISQAGRDARPIRLVVARRCFRYLFVQGRGQGGGCKLSRGGRMESVIPAWSPA